MCIVFKKGVRLLFDLRVRVQCGIKLPTRGFLLNFIHGIAKLKYP